ncbi:hypothetical protein ACLOJK_028998 [Asimina triloba]
MLPLPFIFFVLIYDPTLLFYIKSEEERLTKLHEEEKARKREESERQKREEAECRAKLDEIAERQRQRERELEEKERLRREALLGRPSEPFSWPAEQANGARPFEQPVAATASTALQTSPTPGKYVPRFRRERSDSSSTTATASPPEVDHRRLRHDDRLPVTTDRWRNDDRSRPSAFAGSRSSSSSWGSSRISPHGSER